METKLLPDTSIRLWCLKTSIELNKQGNVDKIIKDAGDLLLFIDGKHKGVSFRVGDD